ncbi:MAG: gephyrin-like molybdotransferase Glp [Candidatus Krumholzibacteriota bacterium]|nr:gephyrin-like molybdotransferase Glp [Candidatus Krumholzibacteriota bacterium]
MKGNNMEMISFEKAFQLMMNSAKLLGKETVSLNEASGRVLFEDIRSDVDMPPFNKSAMDGYACRSADIYSPLEVIETIPAGKAPEKDIGEGECSEIMTGAVVPEGADRVVMVEHTEVAGGRVVVKIKGGGKNICYRAEDVAKGDIVLKKGTVIGASEIAVLAAVGCVEVPVSKTPVLGIIATGSELVEPSSEPGRAKIRNSNSYQLAAQSRNAGFEPRYFGITEDTPEAIGDTIDRYRGSVDLFLLSGGVSMGEFDFVPGVLKDRGFKLLFEKVAVKPGKPTVFGKSKDDFVFGLPGNPVSTFVIFELFVKPFCFALEGAKWEPRRVSARLKDKIERRKTGRISHIPVKLTGSGKVEIVEYHGSAHIHAYTAADGFIAVPAGTGKIEAGETIEVTLIN